MLRNTSVCLAFVFFVSFLFASESSLVSRGTDDESRKQLWSEVEKSLRRGKPKSAVAKLKTIEEGAIEDQQWDEATLAMCSGIFQESQVLQPGYARVIKTLQARIPDTPEPMQPMLKAMLAEYIYTYYTQNQWRFRQRSQTAAAPGDDIESWDLARILNEIDTHFGEALKSADELKKIPIDDYAMLFEAGNVDSKHRPTLYDFVAFRAIEFYSLDEQFIRQQGAFEVSADSPIFSDTKQFLDWKPDTADNDSFVLRALTLLQEVISFHADDEDKTAYLDADLNRLKFGHSVANGSEKTARYRAALQRMADNNLKHPLSSLALAALASSHAADQDELTTAVEVAQQGLARFPKSIGAARCHNIILSIKAKSVHVNTEKVWNGDKYQVEVSYKNIDRVWFRLVEFDYANFKKWGERRSPQSFFGKDMENLIKRPVAKEWSAELKKTTDFKQRLESIEIAADTVDLKPGCYVLICSATETFEANQKADFQTISLAEIWLSDLAAVVRRGAENVPIEVLVVNARSGQPVEGAQVEQTNWVYDGRNSRSGDQKREQTDSNGLTKFFSTPRSRLSRFIIRKDDQSLGFVENVYDRTSRNRGNDVSTVFFTDRSIYRPGQPIQFKCICHSSNKTNNEYKTLPGRNVTIRLYDLNNQVLETKKFRTNEFGSFSGSFTAPRNRATGQMRLHSSLGGQQAIRVEEYKRPKFFVEVDKPTEAFQLSQKVSVSGTATGYTGAAVDSAKVKWRVTRSVRYPFWCRCNFWYLPLKNNIVEIANGETTTSVEGKFDIDFTAEPDNSVDRKLQPVFTYQIFADVTDGAGETRSDSQSTSIGYTSLEASLSTESWLAADADVELKLKVTTLDREGVKASGTMRIFELTPPAEIQRAPLRSNRWGFAPRKDEPDLSKIDLWPTGKQIVEEELTTEESGEQKWKTSLKAGAYKAVFETTDPAGNKVKAELPLLINDINSDKFAVKIPSHFQVKEDSVEPGEEFVAVWGTGYEKGQAFIEIEHRGKVVKSWWTEAANSQHVIRIPIEEKHRGGLQLRVTYIRENRSYSTARRIDVPWSNKDLKIKWEHFVSKLQPGGKETWTAIVSGPNAESVAAEMVAGLYDASLDAFAPHNWQTKFGVFYQDYSPFSQWFYNSLNHATNVYQHQKSSSRSGSRNYRRFDDKTGLYWQGNTFFNSDIAGSSGYGGFGGGGGGPGGVRTVNVSRGSGSKEKGETFGAVPTSMARNEISESEGSDRNSLFPNKKAPPARSNSSSSSDSGIDLKQVSPRKNLKETAFFSPHLKVDDNGSVRIEFEIPEALTKWKFLGFAHDNELKAALLTDEMTTNKDLMVQPNPPRFLREGDQLEFSVKVTNQSDKAQVGKVQLTFADARTAESVDELFSNEQLEQTFEIPAKESRSLFWEIKVPDFVGALTYKAIGGTETVSDGEEGFLPVLSKRILVTESLPLPIRGNETKTFDFSRLGLSGESDTLQSQTLTVQMTSNPSWYAVMSLPYLMEYPHQCSEQTFNRLYANALAHHIVLSDPKIERVFDQWRGTEALDSPLEKNEELRNVLIAESPWLDASKKESQARRDVGLLFDKNRMTGQIQNAQNQLAQMQLSDGAWPWFPGGRANDYITLYVTTGYGRMRHLGLKVDLGPAFKALDRLDWWINERFQRLKQNNNLNDNNLSADICLYLYGRSFFLDDRPVNAKYKTAFDYFVGQGKKHWADLNSRQPQGHLALALKRIGDNETPAEIMKSLTERSVQEDELGMYWNEGQRSWWWYKAPIETQALMIEAYDEVNGDKEKVEELKIWLLKQKQTQNWKTTKATADACYGLLLRGTDLLASDKLVEVKLGDLEIKPESVEAGTGFYEQKFVRGEIKPEMGKIKMTKSDDGIAWGSIHWQYLEDVSKIKSYEGTPLTLKKSLYTKENTEQGPVISEVKGPVNVGDELVMRIELRVDRAMEYVHLKDYRGSGTEPVNVLSRYKFQDGLMYYESTKDTASHFFIDYLPKGTYVFEYSVRVQHRGKYQTGIAELQCMYAPEFNSHSGSVPIVVE